jgi:hypothetical protein
MRATSGSSQVVREEDIGAGFVISSGASRRRRSVRAKERFVLPRTEMTLHQPAMCSRQEDV